MLAVPPMSDSVRSTAPVNASGGFAERSGEQFARRRAPAAPPPAARPGDSVVLLGAQARARRLLRERVLARTRERLGFGDGDGEQLPHFAEAVDSESIADFLGRLLSAQNQLAGRRAAALGAAAARQALDEALRDGAMEAAEILAADAASGGAAVAVVAEALEEYARRLAAALGGG